MSEKSIATLGILAKKAKRIHRIAINKLQTFREGKSEAVRNRVKQALRKPEEE